MFYLKLLFKGQIQGLLPDRGRGILSHDLTLQNVKFLIFQPINRHREQIALQTEVTDRELYLLYLLTLSAPARASSIFRCGC
jgi:hypothetical protein